MRAAELYSIQLVDQLHTELELPAIECAGDLAEIAGSKAGADAAAVLVAFELRVIKQVEAFRTELHVEAFREGKVLKE